MIKSFKCADTKTVFNGEPCRRFRNTERVLARKLDMLDAARLFRDLRSPPANRLEALKGDRTGQHSIRINDQYRLCFIWNDGAESVEVVDYH